MRVKTLRKHANGFGPQYVKNVGRKYDAPETVARNLIATGLVAEDKPAKEPSGDD
ncbi:MAG: hypothetical protein ACK4NZ_07275 [Tsuneonella sp.]